MRQKKNFIIAAVCILIGAPILYWGVQGLAVGYESTSWPTTSGKVLESAVHSTHDRNRGTTFRAELLYKYVVNGESYSGRQLAPGGADLEDSAEVTAILGNHPIGSDIPVYYSPTDPSQSILETGIRAIGIVFLVTGLSFVVAGLVIFIRARRKPEGVILP